MNSAAPGQDLPDLPERALELLCVDPIGLGGAVLRMRPGPELEEWLDALRSSLPEGTPWRRLPPTIDDDRLLGGLDMAASLSAGRPLLATGLLVEANGGTIVVPMAERLGRGTAARIAAAMDRHGVLLERDGMTRSQPTRFCLIALDEGRDDEEGVSPDIADRLALHLEPQDFATLQGGIAPPDPAEVASARRRLDGIRCEPSRLEALCGTALALGVDSLRPTWFAMRAARAAAALRGEREVGDQDITLAARLVLLPRATRIPAPPEEPETDAAEEPQAADDTDSTPPPNPQENEAAADSRQAEDPTEAGEQVLEAVRAVLPPGLLASLGGAASRKTLQARMARGGPPARARARGRPVGVMRGDPRRGFRLHLPATLKAAAPWQRLRRAAMDDARGDRLQVRADDFRVVRFKSRRQTTRIFIVDASGSAAAQRLAETKGAVELLLAESYATRDQVALVAFRGRGAELLLPPTRALARARRELAGLPGGGGTPLAAGLQAARELALDLQRKDQFPVLILMTDGRANVCLDGSTGHGPAGEEALAAARRLKGHGWDSLLVDTSRRPRDRARALAEAMGARYLPLPQPSAGGLSSAAATLTAAS